MPTTGYERTGKCESAGKRDAGSHHVCLRDVGSFCEATGQSNWCEGKQKWCVCEWAFDKAVRSSGCDAFQVDCDATNLLALEHYSKAGKTEAADCLRRKCGI